jgi:tetratricopeptide (TPR) repeat protein
MAGWFLPAICFAVIAVAVGSCSSQGTGRARKLLDGLPSDLVEHLILHNDSTLARFGRETGFEALHSLSNQLDRRSLGLWASGRRDDGRVVDQYRERLARVFSTVFKDTSYSDDIAFVKSMPEDKREELLTARKRFVALEADRSLTPQETLEADARYLQIFSSLGDEGWTAMCKLALSTACERLGDIPQHRRFLVEACADFRSRGKSKMACETLGTLGAKYEAWGQPDSMQACYRNALRIAFRSRMGYQAARIYEFRAESYHRRGSLDMERRFLDLAMDVARQYDPGCYQVRSLRAAMKFNANLGCWDVVENHITQVRGLEHKCERLEMLFSEIELLRTDICEARVKMAYGDIAAADELFRKVNRRLQELNLPDSYRGEDDECSLYRAAGLLSNGRPRDAFEEARKKLSRPPEETLPVWQARLSLVAAKAAYETGDLREARDALDQFDRFAAADEIEYRAESAQRDALGGLVAIAAGDPAGAAESLARGLDRLRRSASLVDPSVGNYLWLAGSGDLRQLTHEVTARDEIAGYGAEFYWREIYELLGASERDRHEYEKGRGRTGAAELAVSPSGKTLVDEFRSVGRATLESVSRLDAVHSVYVIGDKNILRWTAAGGRVRRDVLASSPVDLRKLVASTRKMMSTYPADPDDPVEEELRTNLRALARELLPVEVLEPTASPSTAPFLVTADDFLETIPFEAFDIGAGDAYEPLLARRDVAYARHDRLDTPRRADGPSVILGYSDAPTRRSDRAHPLPELREAEAEARTLAQLDGSAILLTGSSASRLHLRAAWENAPYIYIATHTASEIPYIAAIILAASEAPREIFSTDATLGVVHVRAANLSRCGVVVLSGCSSGSPYLAGGGAAPTLADAFLDAGAEAVVHTFWEVKDEDARRIGTGFMTRWRKANLTAVHALAETRRGELRGPRGIRHPSSWASYAITVSRF